MIADDMYWLKYLNSYIKNNVHYLQKVNLEQ